MTNDILNKRITLYEMELKNLETMHERFVETFKAQVAVNQNRFAQINGAILELKELVKINEHPDCSISVGGTEGNPCGIPGDIGGVGDPLRTFMGDRKLGKPDPATSEDGLGHYPFDPGGYLGNRPH